MARAKSVAAALTVGLVLAGCSFANDVLWPTLTGDSPARQAASPQQAQAQAPASDMRQIPPSPAEASPDPTLTPAGPPRLGSTQFQPPPVTQAAPTGTFVGQKVQQFRGELEKLQTDVRSHNQTLQEIRRETAEHSQRYHSTVAAINSRLQVGTTPGNPILVSQWNAAQSLMDQVSADVARMNSLATETSGTSTLSAYLLESTRAAYGLSGAVDEDHRQLGILEDEINRTVVLIDRLANELSTDIGRQGQYLSGERRNLTALSLAVKNGELYGSSLANRAFESATPLASAAPGAAAPGPADASRRRPLVVIRFDRPNPSYEQALYSALSGALNRRPSATFDLVAVAPQQGTPVEVSTAQNRSKRNAERVLRSMSEMGLPMDRVRLSAVTSPATQSNEVHVYVR